jgi:hypothetical protein
MSGCPVKAVQKQLGKSYEGLNDMERDFEAEISPKPVMCITDLGEYYVDFVHNSRYYERIPDGARSDDGQIWYDPSDEHVPTDIVNFYLNRLDEWDHLLNEYIEEQVSLRKELCADVDSCFPEHGCWYYGP